MIQIREAVVDAPTDVHHFARIACTVSLHNTYQQTLDPFHLFVDFLN